MTPVVEDEPPPIPNASVPVWELVIKDMQERDEVGRERYGTPLQTNNGRDHLVDAYQELLDQAVYLRAEIEERKNRIAIDEEALALELYRRGLFLQDVEDPTKDYRNIAHDMFLVMREEIAHR